MEFIASTVLGIVLAYVTYLYGEKTARETMRRLQQIQDSIRNQGSHEFNIERIRCLHGLWKGNVNQQNGPGGVPIKFPLEARMEVTSAQEIVGCFRYTFDEIITNLEIRGKAMDNRIIVLYFFDSNKSIMRFGTIMLELSALAHALDGHFVAYAAETDAIVTGEVKLSKIVSRT